MKGGFGPPVQIRQRIWKFRDKKISTFVTKHSTKITKAAYNVVRDRLPSVEELAHWCHLCDTLYSSSSIQNILISKGVPNLTH